MATHYGASSRRRPERAPWLGHNAWWIQIATVAALLALITTSYAVDIVTGTTPRSTEPVWSIDWTAFGILAVLISSQCWLAHRQTRHDRRLCERCIRTVPLNTQAAVDHHRRALQPWCPQCRNDNGWDDDVIPEPSPDPQIKADR